MNDLFQLTRDMEDVLPSGVPFSVRELLTGDQSDLAKRVKQGDKKAFIKMLTTCIKSIGDNTNVSEKDIEKMLANDINYAFLRLRQHTFRGDQVFKFKNEFPLGPGEKEKHIESFSITFSEEFFKTRPYIWTAEEMERLERNFFHENPEAEEYIKPFEKSFPVMYQNYDDMLAEQREREFTFPNTDTTIKWRLLDGNAEKVRRASYSNMDDFAASLYLRNATRTLIFKEDKDEKQPLEEGIEWGKVPMYYSDKFRGEFMRVEGTVDTIITVRSEIKPDKVERINLVQTVAFFAPSLGT